MHILGLDPGLKGALALLAPDGGLLELVDMPTLAVTKSRREIDTQRLVETLEDWRGLQGEFRVVVERAMVMPGQGGSSGFKIGIGFGQILGILAAQKVSHTTVTPQVWQRALFGKLAKGTGKDRARAHAAQMFPRADLGRRKTQDRSDAICIALYGLERWGRAAA